MRGDKTTRYGLATRVISLFLIFYFSFLILLGCNGVLGGGVSGEGEGEDPPPAAPTGLIATATASGGIDLVWDVVADAGYKVYRSLSADETYYPVNSSPISSASYTDSRTLIPGTTYYYKVTAVAADGTEGPQSDYAFATLPGSSEGYSRDNAITLSDGIWSEGTINSNRTIWYKFTATAEESYHVYWNDREPNNSNTVDMADIKVSAKFDGRDLFTDVDIGRLARNISDCSGTVYLTVTLRNNTSDYAGDYAICFTTAATRPENEE
jgi:hypothetical protein